MNLHVPQSEEARSEAVLLMRVQDQLISPRFGGPIIGGLRDFITGAYLMTKDDTVLTNQEFANLAMLGGFIDLDIENIDLEKAKYLCSLPKILGTHPDIGKEITVNVGRFGPYLKCENKSARLENVEEIFSVGLNRAVTLIAEAKPGRISSSLIKFEILSRSVDNLGEKNAFSTSTMNLQPLSLYSVSVLSSPASISRFLVRKSPSTGDDW